MNEQRTPVARARAELALVRLLHELGDDAPFMVVMGGLTPSVLASATIDAAEHLGTTDVDVLLITQVEADQNLEPVERALGRIHFKPDPNEGGWRWKGEVDGVTVKIEFLCDLAEHPEGEVLQPEGCTELAAQNLRGTGYVAHGFSWQELTGVSEDGAKIQVKVRFAGLAGYLLSKCVAARNRAADKDYYDLVYVLESNEKGGPEGAARSILEGSFADELPPLKTTFLEIRERFRNVTDSGPVGYSNQAIQASPEAAIGRLRADAVDIVQRFIEALGK